MDDIHHRTDLLWAERRPSHATHHRLTGDTEVKHLANHGEDGNPRPLALWILPAGLRPNAAKSAMHRVKHAFVDDIECLARLGKFAKDEVHNRSGLRPRDDKSSHPVEYDMQTLLRGSGILGCVWRLCQSRTGNGPYHLDDMVGACGPQSLLSPKMISNGADVGLGERRYVARRRTVIPPPTKQFQGSVHKSRAGLLGWCWKPRTKRPDRL